MGFGVSTLVALLFLEMNKRKKCDPHLSLEKGSLFGRVRLF